MKAIYSRLFARTQELVDDAAARSDVLSTAVAMAVSHLADLPSAPVGSAAGYYNLQVSSNVRARLGMLNENIVFGMKAALEEARQFWLLRYASAHPTQLPIFCGDYGFFDTLMGVPDFVSPELHTFANEHKHALFKLAFDVVALIREEEGVDA